MRLALQIANKINAEFEDGVWWVGLFLMARSDSSMMIEMRPGAVDLFTRSAEA